MTAIHDCAARLRAARCRHHKAISYPRSFERHARDDMALLFEIIDTVAAWLKGDPSAAEGIDTNDVHAAIMRCEKPSDANDRT